MKQKQELKVRTWAPALPGKENKKQHLYKKQREYEDVTDQWYACMKSLIATCLLA